MKMKGWGEWRILTNKEIYEMVKEPAITETKRLNNLCWFGHVQRMEGNRIPKKVLYINLETTKLRDGLRSRWQDEGRDDGRLDGGKGWKESYITKRNGRSSCEQQGIVAFFNFTHTNGMNEIINIYIYIYMECISISSKSIFHLSEMILW